MTPETGTHNGTILEESARIADALLDVQGQLQVVNSEAQTELLAHIREELGYPSATQDYASELSDARIIGKTPVVTPEAVSAVLPVSKKSAETTSNARQAIGDILLHNDDRLVVITGPCSIHDSEAALEYAGLVAGWRDEYGDTLEIVMRTYFEKPRTTLDWKGFLYDPKLDDSYDIDLGIVASRMLMCQITNQGVPGAMERLNALTPQFFNGLVAYDAIGARNAEDQKAREYGSGTSSPVGFKHSTDGNIQKAIDAVITARGPHTFIGVDMNGNSSQINTAGNELAHIILRGSEYGPNYDRANVNAAKARLQEHNLPLSIVIDASHANSGKVASRQPKVIGDIAHQIGVGQQAIRGVMIESNLIAGSQSRKDGRDRPIGLERLEYGQSITDECIDPSKTEASLRALALSVNKRRKNRTIRH